MKKKLRSSKGMTLTELIMALVIVSLIGVALTTGINGGVRVYRDATRLYEAETLCGTILTYMEDEYRFARNIQDDGTYDSQTFGNGVKAVADDGKILIELPPAAPAGSGPTSYKLLSDTAYTSGLKVSTYSASYDSAKGQVEITVAVGPDGTSQYVKHSVKVAPLGG